MLSVFDAFRDVTLGTTLFRLLIAVLCGMAVGIERSYKNRPAGFRTHILVCTGACIASLTGLYLYLNMSYPTDMSRIGAQVISGLGFIGAGTIIVTKKNTIKGLTTAAGLWVCGVIGLAAGAGFYEGAILTTLLVLLTETLLASLGMRIQHQPEFQVIIHYNHTSALDKAARYIKDKDIAITNLQITSSNDSDIYVYSAFLHLRPTGYIDKEDLLLQISFIPGIISAEER